MEIRKGPYGHFVIKKIEDIGSIHDYTREIVAENIPGHMLPIYIIPTVSSYEASYDFSGLVPLGTRKPTDTREINMLRKALGDLLLSLADLPDYLLSPAALLFDDRYIFTDESYTDLKMCFDPVRIDPQMLCIQSLKSTGLRDFLNSDCLSGVISSDETDGIIYAIEQNDEVLFRKNTGKIKLPVPDLTEERGLIDMNEFKIVILFSLISLIFSLTGLTFPALIAVAAELFFGVKIRKILINKPEIQLPSTPDDTRRQMLFGKENNGSLMMDAVILSFKDTKTGEEEKKAIYTDKATIGSDRFLCDIFSSDKGISPVHAEIKRVNRTYYVTDLSSDNSTYLNNVRLLPGRDYEIKSEQTLTCGNKDFRIEIV